MASSSRNALPFGSGTLLTDSGNASTSTCLAIDESVQFSVTNSFGDTFRSSWIPSPSQRIGINSTIFDVLAGSDTTSLFSDAGTLRMNTPRAGLGITRYASESARVKNCLYRVANEDIISAPKKGNEAKARELLRRRSKADATDASGRTR
jgi:hypothetical protein